MTQHDQDPGTQLVERMALAWEVDGLPRIAGRIIGYLLLQPGARSLDDIAGALGVSKASVSNDARRLEALGLAERTSFPGDRRDYYTIAPDMVSRAAANRLGSIRRIHAALADACEFAEDGTPVRDRLERIVREHGAIIALLERFLRDSRDIPDAT